jgi:hypothetical protein
MANQLKEDKAAGAPPALFEHCVNVYKAMFEHAHAVTTDDLKGTVGDVIVYEGFLTKLITQELNLSVPYYTSIRKALIDMGCIRQLRRGGSTTESQWELVYEPTLRAFMEQKPERSRPQSKTEARDVKIAELEKEVRGLLDFKMKVMEYIANKEGVEIVD